MSNRNPSKRTRFKSNTPELDEAICKQVDAIMKIDNAEELTRLLDKCDAEKDSIRERRYSDTLREMNINQLEDAARTRIHELHQGAKTDVKESNSKLEKTKKVVNITINMGEDAA